MRGPGGGGALGSVTYQVGGVHQARIDFGVGGWEKKFGEHKKEGSVGSSVKVVPCL